MSEMVERVARAIVGDDLFSEDGMTAHQAASPLTVYDARKDALGHARRVIEAMHEPTRVMVALGEGSASLGGNPYPVNPAEVWRDMIGGALWSAEDVAEWEAEWVETGMIDGPKK